MLKFSRGQSTSSSQSSQGSQPPWKSKRPFGKSFLNKERNLFQHNFTSTKNTFSGDCTNPSVKRCASFGTKPFSKRENRNFSTLRKTVVFFRKFENTEKQLTILEWVSGLKIDFQEEPFQERVTHQAQMSMQEFELISQEVEAMLTKENIHLVHSKGSQFLSNLFQVPKKDGSTSLLSI